MPSSPSRRRAWTSRGPRAALVGSALVALAASLTVGDVRAAAAAAPAAPAPTQTVRLADTPHAPAFASAHQVTLITGDVVTVAPSEDSAGPGRTGGGAGNAGSTGSTVTVKAAVEGAGYRTQTVGGHLYVLPDAVLPYLASDRIDRELFDVTALIDQGFDDATTKTLPVIVQYKPSAPPAHSVPTPFGAQRSAVLNSVDGAALTTLKSQAEGFWAAITPTRAPATGASFDAGISKLYLDAKVEADLAESVAQIGAPQAWAAGYDGAGTKVAVLDTGIDADHPDLSDQITESQSFVPDETVEDHNGHGTHVASTIAGTGAASDGVEKGVAPGARLVIGKVLGNDGSGQESWIIDGMEWAATHADIVSMSLGSSEASDGTTPMDQAVDTLSDSTDALFVIAAGNNGMVGGISAPGAADAALTVGAVDGQDQLAYFSNMGPRLGDSALKPDVVAPGVDISAARSHWVDGTGDYQTMSGTSMATPHVAGAAAILAELHPSWTGHQLKDALMSSAKGLDDYTPYQVGTGRVDVPATMGDIHATGSTSFGFLRWPNADATPIDRTITYTNDGDSEVTLDLAASFREGAGSGDPAADGVLTMSADQVTVPAHDSASVSLTADPSLAPSGTQYAGTVVASLEGAPITRTSIGMDKESERYSLTLDATGRDGQPASTWVTLHAFDDSILEPVFVDGETTVRLPAGQYSAMAFMDTWDAPDSKALALLGSPQIDLTQDRTVELDASTAVPVRAEVGRRAEAVATRIGYFSSPGSGLEEALWTSFDIDNVYASPTEPVSQGSFEFVARLRLRTPWFDVSRGAHHYDVTQAPGGAWLDGKSTLQTVYAGAGTAAEYDGLDVTGKAVVISRADTVPDRQAAVTARQQGAAVLLVVNDAPEEFNDWIYGDNSETVNLPVGGVSGLEGTSLVALAQSGKPIQVSGDINSPWVYDLQLPFRGHIPDDLTYRPDTDDLTRVRATYYGNKDRVGGEFRFDFRPFSPYSSGFEFFSRFPQVRTEWVNNPKGTNWVQNASILHGGWSTRGDHVVYHPGTDAAVDWFNPVVHPRLGAGYWRPERQGDFLQINLPSFGDAGPGHSGGMDPSDQTIRLYDGQKLLKKSVGWQSVSAEVSPKLKKLRVTSDAERPMSWKTSTATHSVYEFWTKNIPDPGLHNPLLPLVQVNFHVDTDLAGDTDAGRRDSIGFSAWTMKDATLVGHLVGGRMDVSYDGGTTWQHVALSGDTGRWRAHLNYPDNPRRFVSLRATAWDSKGNSTTQTIIRAYGLK